MKFKTIEDLLACADKIVAKTLAMFPAAEPHKVRFAVLNYLLHNSIITNP